MIDSRFVSVLVLSVATVAFMNYFMPSRDTSSSTMQPGQSYTVPKLEDLSQPMKKEVDFVDRKRTEKEEIITVQTDNCSYYFSNYGGVLAGLEFKKHKGMHEIPLKTVHHKTFYEQEQGFFLLAFDEKTPYFYTLHACEEDHDSHRVIYKTDHEHWTLTKTYEIDKESYRVSLLLDFTPRGKDVDELRPRLFYEAPFVTELTGYAAEGVASGVDRATIKTVQRSDEDGQAWVMPHYFGGQNTYFSHLLIDDKDNFTQRAFYKRLSDASLFSIIEGPAFRKQSSFMLSFYLGPKVFDELVRVDDNLQGLLSFGWLSWICRFILRFLSLLYSYFQNYGIAIIILAFLIRLLLLPLSLRGMALRERLQRYQPAIAKIRQKYKDDVQRMHAEINRFYKEHNLSLAAPVLGCLPLLLQAPIMFALYRVLNGYVGLYQAPFLGYLTDLSAKDPYYILPIVCGIAGIWQAHVMNTGMPKQKIGGAQSEYGKLLFPLVLTFVFAGLPAGIVLYWTVNNLLIIGETYLGRVIHT